MFSLCASANAFFLTIRAVTSFRISHSFTADAFVELTMSAPEQLSLFCIVFRPYFSFLLQSPAEATAAVLHPFIFSTYEKEHCTGLLFSMHRLL